MLPGNIEEEIRKIIKKHGKDGWLRSNKCAKKYMNLFPTREKSAARIRYFRFRRHVEDGKIASFQVKKLPNNISFIGLGTTNPDFLGTPEAQIFAFIYKWRQEIWVEIPLQINEREGDKYFIDPDDDVLGNNDELAFMAKDLGDRVSENTWPEDPDAKANIRYEVEVVDDLVRRRLQRYVVDHLECLLLLPEENSLVSADRLCR